MGMKKTNFGLGVVTKILVVTMIIIVSLIVITGYHIINKTKELSYRQLAGYGIVLGENYVDKCIPAIVNKNDILLL